MDNRSNRSSRSLNELNQGPVGAQKCCFLFQIEALSSCFQQLRYLEAALTFLVINQRDLF